MLTLVIILVIVAVIAGLFGFGISNIINQIAKFIFIVLVVFLLIALFYGYTYFRPAVKKDGLPPTEVPVITPIDKSVEISANASIEEVPEYHILDEEQVEPL